MRYCKKCLYPENAKPTIIFDEHGVCSGCNYNDSRKDDDVDWAEREKMFRELMDEAKETAAERGNSHDCIIPVSGGKDSHYQVWLLKEKYGMNPLLVTFNHGFNSPAGQRNLRNLVEKSGCDLIRYTAGKDSVRKISRYMLEECGDLAWHYHAGIGPFPFQVAVEKNIPYIIWGEHGFAELTGMVSLKDFVEYTKWTLKEHSMRGIDPHDLIGHHGIKEHDIAPYIFPDDDKLEEVEVRGLYVSNYFKWNAKEHAELMKKEWGFGYVTYDRERSFNLHGKIEDHSNDVHDYLKYLKFGYGRGTDDASMEIRHGRLSRKEGIALVKKYDPVEPSTLQYYCDFMGITKEEFYKIIEPMRDHDVWQKDDNGNWKHIAPIWETEEYAKESEIGVGSKTFESRDLYYNPNNPPEKTGEDALDVRPKTFIWV